MLGVFIVMSLSFLSANGLHMSGSWHSDEFFMFVGKFGFEQTNDQDLLGTLGYIYGNVTSSRRNVTGQMALVVLDSEYFTEFFRNRLRRRSEACGAMFDKMESIMWDERCNKDGFEDFLRRIPCQVNELCEEETIEPARVIAGYQFTYHVRDTYQPR